MRWSQGVNGRFVIHILDKIRVGEYAESNVKGEITMAKLGRSVVGFLALVFAIILLVLSIDVFDMSIDPTYDGYTEHEIYGGDADTGIQNAAADTANAAATSARRMGELNNTVVYIGGGLLLGASFAFFVASAWMFVGCKVDTAIVNRQEENIASNANRGQEEMYSFSNTTFTEKTSFWQCPHCYNDLYVSESGDFFYCHHCQQVFEIVNKGETNILREI